MFDCGVVRMCLWLILYELDYAYASWCIALIDNMNVGIDCSDCLMRCVWGRRVDIVEMREVLKVFDRVKPST